MGASIPFNQPKVPKPPWRKGHPFSAFSAQGGYLLQSVCPERAPFEVLTKLLYVLAGALTRLERLLHLLIDEQRKAEHLLCSSPGTIRPN